MADLSGSPDSPEDLPTGAEKVEKVRAMFDDIAPRYDLVNRVMTFGMDMGWRRDLVRMLRLPPGSLVLDLACGTGDICRELAKARLRAVGFDLSAGMLAARRTHAPLVLADILNMPVADSSADGVTCGFALRNVEDLRRLFEETHRILKPGGRMGLLEVTEPRSRVARRAHKLYFQKAVPLIGGALSSREAYRYLPRSVAYLPDVRTLLQMIGSCGFVDVMRCTRGLSAAQIITATKA